jgi:hypothetical protein
VSVPEARKFPEPTVPQFRIEARVSEMLGIVYFPLRNF